MRCPAVPAALGDRTSDLRIRLDQSFLVWYCVDFRWEYCPNLPVIPARF
jgi:hypothetical protein